MALDQEIIDYVKDSAETYRFLSHMVFKELDAATIEAVAAIEFPTETGNEHLDEGYRLVRRYFNFSASDRRTQLACEYARIFLAAGVYVKSDKTAIPYESVFTSPERIMMQASRDDVVRRFARDGFKVNPALHEPEDHLAFELEYLAHLNDRAAVLAEAGDTVGLRANFARQVDFIETHILNWLPALTAAARGFAKLAFYPGMLLVAQGTAETCRDTLTALADELTGEQAA
ncbi:molecular chaperone TorD family protein [Adlercreutzia equolifaciens]|uniref:TorD/DmsD family molecular chaperone n=1 Tax=Adlercreutzia equolifaciens TaxID=446660 RepID=UPI0023AF432C|nr:molecular chaperone TorD family protein [Adlercreutzia equolifaciens]MDE8702396.1 molecular chaperone TorD family protein [Adlercreutzia equolifaciens]